MMRHECWIGCVLFLLDAGGRPSHRGVDRMDGVRRSRAGSSQGDRVGRARKAREVLHLPCESMR